MKKLIVLAAVGAALVASAAGCASTETAETGGTKLVDSCAGVVAVIDYASLGKPLEQHCVDTERAMTALDVLAAAEITVTPSTKYGDAIVCRVNGLPAADQELKTELEGPYFETCAELGPAWATWSVWVYVDGSWQLGQEAINTQKLQPGEQIGLVWQQGDFTDMNEWAPPAV